MNDTPTPETNALIATDQHHLEDDQFMPVSTYWRMCDLARKLERERDEWKAKYIQQNKDLGCELRDPNGTIWDHAKTLQRERDEAREVLREIRDNEVNPEDEADKFLRDHLPSELSKVREQRDAVTLRLGETQERMIDAERQRDRLAEALVGIKNELGVPQPEYPAPVANAVKIADEALNQLNL
jgi:uncharacterized coiled-coil DUF342 family protein